MIGDPMSFTHLGVSSLLANPSAEIYSGLSGQVGVVDNWVLEAGGAALTPTQAVDQVHQGLYSQKLVYGEGQTSPLTSYLRLRYILPIPAGGDAATYFSGAQFAIKAWVRCDDPTHLTFKTRVSLCDSSWSELSGADDVLTVPASTWVQSSQVADLTTPPANLYGIEVRLYSVLATDNPGTTPSVWWDDVSFYDAYTFTLSPTFPLPIAPDIPGTTARTIGNDLFWFTHSAAQAKYTNGRLNFGLIHQTQMERLRQFWLEKQPVLWTPNLPRLPATMKVFLTTFSEEEYSPKVLAGYRVTIGMEQL